MPVEIVRPILEQLFDSPGYVSFILGEKETVSVEELKEHEEFQGFEGSGMNANYIEPLHVVLFADPAYQTPLANSVFYATNSGKIKTLNKDEMKKLKYTSYWEIDTKYFIKGVETACGDQTDYALVKECMNEWKNALDKLSTAVKKGVKR